MVGWRQKLRWLLVSLLAIAGEQAAAEPDWLTGAALKRQLAAPVGAAWSQKPLRGALESLAEARRVAFFLDRRVDPGAKLNLSVGQLPLQAAMQQIGSQFGLETVQVGPVTYFGPAQAAGELHTLLEIRRQELRRVPEPRRRAFLQRSAWQWDMLATPGELLEQLATTADVPIEGIELVPHDLWPAVNLPPLTFVERLSLVAIGFDMTFRVAPDGSRVRLAPIDRPVHLVRDYPDTPRIRTLVENPAGILKQLEFKPARGRMFARGSLAAHEHLATLLSGRTPRRSPAARQTIKKSELRVEKLTIPKLPVGPLLEQLAKRLNRTLRFDHDAIRQAGISLNQLVELELTNATVDEVFEATVAGTGLVIRREGETLVITADAP